MADSKNNQTAPAGLPEKEWLALEEVAVRWGCTVNDLLHYGITERLEICADFCEATVQMGDFGENDEWNVLAEFPIEGVLEISANDLKRISKNPNTQTKPEWLWIIHEELKHEEIQPEFVFKISRENAKTWRSYKGILRVSRDENGNPLIDGVSACNLVVVKEELDAFEQEHRIGAYAGTMPNLEENPKTVNRPWAFLIDSPNHKKSPLYKKDAKRIWKSLTAEEKETWAREAVVRNEGNKTEAGRELGISANGIKYILKKKP